MSKRNASIQVFSSDFTRAMREMAKLTGISFKDIIRSETKSILEAAAKKTAAAQVKLIEENVRKKPVRTLNGKKYFMANSLPDSIWAQLERQMKTSIARRKAARGLAKKSWMQVAGRLGIDIDVPGYVAKSTTSAGDYPENASATESAQGRDFFIRITNARTYSQSVFDAIRAAMRGRTAFFKKNLRLGVFQKTSEIAAKYPGLKALA